MQTKGVFCFALFMSAAVHAAAGESAIQKTKTVLSAALAQEEMRLCYEGTAFLKDVVFKDDAFIKAAKDRDAREVAAVASKYAAGAVNALNADYFFYMPNARFYVRVNDKDYRGRMRLPADVRNADSSCYWENLPSGNVVYSVLAKVGNDFPGYVKISIPLSKVIGNLPDMIAGTAGKVRLYTAVDKNNLRKRQWLKVHKDEPNKPDAFCWCSGEDLSFLSTLGNGRELPKKALRAALSAIDGEEPFSFPEDRLAGDAVIIKSARDVRLGAVAFVTDIP